MVGHFVSMAFADLSTCSIDFMIVYQARLFNKDSFRVHKSDAFLLHLVQKKIHIPTLFFIS